MKTIDKVLIGIIILLVLIGLFSLAGHFKPDWDVIGKLFKGKKTYVEAPPNKEADNVPKKDSQTKSGKFKSYDSKIGKSLSGLTEEQKKDIETGKSVVLATAALPPNRGGYKAFASMDTETGETKISAKPETPPFLDVHLTRFDVGARYGIGSPKGQEVNGYLQWDPVSLGRETRLYIGGYAEGQYYLDQPRDQFGGKVMIQMHLEFGKR